MGQVNVKLHPYLISLLLKGEMIARVVEGRLQLGREQLGLRDGGVKQLKDVFNLFVPPINSPPPPCCPTYRLRRHKYLTAFMDIVA